MEKAGLNDVRRLPYPHAFPLGLITAKFGLNILLRLGALRYGCLRPPLPFMDESQEIRTDPRPRSFRLLCRFFAKALNWLAFFRQFVIRCRTV